MEARILLFELDGLRRVHADRATPGLDPRTDTAPFRAFRAALLAEAARVAQRPCELTMWWEGTFNGYQLAVAVEPAEALPGLDLAEAGAGVVDDERVAPPRPDRYPLAHVEPGRATVARDVDGTIIEAPFGAATGHFGAPGMRRLP